MKQLDDAVRDALHNLAHQGRPPVDPGRAALAAGRRLRHRQTALTAVAAVAAMAAVLTPVVALNAVRGGHLTTADRTQGPPPTPEGWPSPTLDPSPSIALPKALVTIEGLRLAGGAKWNEPANLPNFVYDQVRKAYATVPYDLVTPNRDGTLALVTRHTSPYLTGLLDLRTGKVDWRTLNAGAQRGMSGRYQWSPDGRKALIWMGVGCAIYDVASGRLSPLNLTADQPVWHPDSRHLVVAEAGKPTPRAIQAPPPTTGRPPHPVPSATAMATTVRRLRIYDLTGHLTGTVPVPGAVDGPANWSPDLAHVIAFDDVHNRLDVYDTKTGARTARLPDVNRIASGEADDVWWSGNDRMLIKVFDSKRDVMVLQTFDLTGRVVATHDLPAFGNGYHPVLYPSD